jgi:hypothetical protein
MLFSVAVIPALLVVPVHSRAWTGNRFAWAASLHRAYT